MRDLPQYVVHGIESIEQIGGLFRFRFYRQCRKLSVGSSPIVINAPVLCLVMERHWVQRNMLLTSQGLEDAFQADEVLH